MSLILGKTPSRISVGGLAAVTGVGLGLWVAGRSPWLLVCATALAIAWAFAQRVSWTLAAAAGVSVPLAWYAVVVHFSSALPVSLATTGAISLTLITALALIFCWHQGSLKVPAGRFTLITSGVLAIVPLAFSLISAIKGRAWFALEWAMNGDIAWHLIVGGRLVDAGGLVSEIHNPAPMTIALMGMGAAPGRPVGPLGEVLPHDIYRLAEMWVLLILLSGVLAALVALRTLRHTRPELRAGAAVLAYLIATSSYFVGFAFIFGFFNATPSVVLLLVAWLAWLETKETPVAAFSVMAFSAVALLATWAPLALIPLALGGAAIIIGPVAAARAKSHYAAPITESLTESPTEPLSTVLPSRAQRRREADEANSRLHTPVSLWRSLAPYLVISAPVLAYLFGITLNDLRRQGEALILDGGIQDIGPLHWLFVGGCLVTFSALLALRDRSSHQFVGVVIVGMATTVVLAFLIYQLVAAGRPWRGYYPIKFIWFVCCLLIILLFVNAVAFLADRAATASARTITTNLVAVTLAGAITALVMFQAPVAPLRHQLPLIDVALDTPGFAAPPGASSEELFAIMATDHPAIAASFISSPVDRWMNMWLLQMHSDLDTDPIRDWAFTLDPLRPYQICAATKAWNRPVTVYTTVADMKDALTVAVECADLNFAVVLLDRRPQR